MSKTVITVAASAPTLYYYCTQHSGMGGQANTNSTFGSSNFSGEFNLLFLQTPHQVFNSKIYTSSSSKCYDCWTWSWGNSTSCYSKRHRCWWKWQTYFTSLGTANQQYLKLNDYDAVTNYSGLWGLTQNS